MGKKVAKHTLLSIRFRMVLDGYTAFCNFLEIGKSLGPQTLHQGLLKRLRDVAGFVVGRSFVIRRRVGSPGLPKTLLGGSFLDPLVCRKLCTCKNSRTGAFGTRHLGQWDEGLVGQGARGPLGLTGPKGAWGVIRGLGGMGL